MEMRRRERLLLVAAAVCIALLAGERFVARPLVGLWKDRSARIVELRRSLDESDLLIEREDVIRDRWEAMLDASLSTEPALAEEAVLNALSDWSRESGVAVTSLKPRWLRPEDEPWRGLEMRVAVQGDMRRLTGFLRRLEASDLPVALEQADLAARDDAGSELLLDVRFVGLVLLEEAGS